MGPEWVAIIALVALFVVGTVLPINMGALAYVAAWLVGMYSLDLDEKEILAGVSGDLILTLIGVTYLFAIARNNGTVDLIVADRGEGGRRPGGADPVGDVRRHRACSPRIGAVSPAACAIIGPIALGFAGRYGISPLMMGMFVVHGAQAGGFSPISIYGIDHQLGDGGRRPAQQRDHDLPGQPGRQPDPGGDPVRRPRRPEPDEHAGRPGRAGTGERATCAVAEPACPPAARRPRPRRAPEALGVRRDQVLTLARVPRRRPDRAGLRQEHRLRRDHRRGAPGRCSRPTSTRTRSSRSPGRPCSWSPASAPTPRS